MEANRTTRAAGNESSVAPTAAQTAFNARDRLTGDLDDTTVRQAVEAGSPATTPTPDTANPRFQNSDLAESAEVGR